MSTRVTYEIVSKIIDFCKHLTILRINFDSIFAFHGTSARHSNLASIFDTSPKRSPFNWGNDETKKVTWKIPSTLECLKLKDIEKFLIIDLSEVMNLVYLKVHGSVLNSLFV